MDFLPLAPRARILFYLQSFTRLAIFWTPAAVVGAFVAMSWISPLWAVVGAGACWFGLFLLAVWMPTLRFDRWGYAMRDDDLLISRGVLFRSITAIPLSRIQHVDTQQGPLEQWLGLARVRIHTASGVGGDGMIPGLERDAADSLRDALVHRGGDSGGGLRRPGGQARQSSGQQP